MNLPIDIIKRMHIYDITLFLSACPICGDGTDTKPEIFNLPSIPWMVAIDCKNKCKFLSGKTLIYDSAYNCGEAWNNVVDSFIFERAIFVGGIVHEKMREQSNV